MVVYIRIYIYPTEERTMATDRSIKDKRYEEKHKEERKAKYMI